MATNKQFDLSENENNPRNFEMETMFHSGRKTSTTPSYNSNRPKQLARKSRITNNRQQKQQKPSTIVHETIEDLKTSLPSTSSSFTPVLTKRPRAFSESEDSSDDNIPNVTTSDSPYEIKPSASSFFLNVNLVNEMYLSFKNYDFTEKNIFRSLEELDAAKLKFQRYASVKKSTFSQFKYKKPPTLFLLTNIFGLSVNTTQDFMTKLNICNINELLPKHRVSVLLPTATHWWHAESKALFETAINRLINDMTTLANVDDFKSALQNFNLHQVMKETIATLKSKLLTGSKIMQGQRKPSVFGVRVYNTSTIPSRVAVTLAKIKEDQRGAKQVKFKELLTTPKHVHGITLLTINGFKITKSGISVDLSLEALVYDIISTQMSKAGQKPTIKQLRKSNVMEPMQNDDSSDEDISLPQTQNSGSSLDVSNWF